MGGSRPAVSVAASAALLACSGVFEDAALLLLSQ